MEARTLLVALVVFASGCAHTGTNPGDTSIDKSKGLEVTEFKIADKTLKPGQQSVITLTLTNHHTGKISIEDISLYNTGFLKVGERSCSPQEIKPARKGYAPQMECSWTVKAPEGIQGFKSKPLTMQLNLAYRSSLTNKKEPMQVLFKPVTGIEERSKVKHSFSNGEVRAVVSYENPVAMEGGLVSFDIKDAGPGRVDSSYRINYRPEQVFSDCPDKLEPVHGDQAIFTCEVVSDSRSTRNLVFSTYYKYVKAPSLDVEVVRP
ncbi:MAG: hypothetical protein ABEJ91_02770 [Candidatus Nanohaloarchaea archaeon]